MEDNKPTKKYNEMVAPRIEDIRAWARDGVTEEAWEEMREEE